MTDRREQDIAVALAALHSAVICQERLSPTLTTALARGEQSLRELLAELADARMRIDEATTAAGYEDEHGGCGCRTCQCFMVCLPMPLETSDVR